MYMGPKFSKKQKTRKQKYKYRGGALNDIEKARLTFLGGLRGMGKNTKNANNIVRKYKKMSEEFKKFISNRDKASTKPPNDAEVKEVVVDGEVVEEEAEEEEKAEEEAEEDSLYLLINTSATNAEILNIKLLYFIQALEAVIGETISVDAVLAEKESKMKLELEQIQNDVKILIQRKNEQLSIKEKIKSSGSNTEKLGKLRNYIEQLKAQVDEELLKAQHVGIEALSYIIQHMGLFDSSEKKVAKVEEANKHVELAKQEAKLAVEAVEAVEREELNKAEKVELDKQLKIVIESADAVEEAASEAKDVHSIVIDNIVHNDIIYRALAYLLIVAKIAGNRAFLATGATARIRGVAETAAVRIRGAATAAAATAALTPEGFSFPPVGGPAAASPAGGRAAATASTAAATASTAAAGGRGVGQRGKGGGGRGGAAAPAAPPEPTPEAPPAPPEPLAQTDPAVLPESGKKSQNPVNFFAPVLLIVLIGFVSVN
jgi:hypothetical protein